MEKEGGRVTSRDLTNPVQVMPPAEFDATWGRAWEGYLKARRDKGLDDSRRLPPSEFLYRRCDI